MIHESTRTKSKTLAREAERQRRRELEERWNQIKKRELPPTLTLASKRWLEKRAALNPTTRKTYEAAIKHLRSILGATLVCEIEAQHVVAYQNGRLAQGAAGATINKEIACLSSILAEYGVWEQLRRDVKRLAENARGRVLSLEEEKSLVERTSLVGVHQGTWTPLYTVTVLGLNTGMRHKEIRTLKWRNLDLEDRVLRVAESKTEAGRGRPVPLTQPAWIVLEMWSSRFPDRKPDDYVFPACENGRIRSDRAIANWRTAWRRATSLVRCPMCGELQNTGATCRNEGCDADIRKIRSPFAGLRFHDLRHSAATKLLEHGTPFAVVAQILGWSASTAVRMAKRYGHIRPEVQRQALDAVATSEILRDVNQIVHQVPNGVELQLPN